MRALQNVVAGFVVLLAAAFGYQLITSSGLETKVEENRQNVEDITRRTDEHTQELADHETRLDELAREIEKARERLSQAESRLKVAEETLGNLAALDAQQRAELDEVRKEYARFRQDYDQRVQELAELRDTVREQDRLNQEFDQRLRELEKRAGVSEVAP